MLTNIGKFRTLIACMLAIAFMLFTGCTNEQTTLSEYTQPEASPPPQATENNRVSQLSRDNLAPDIERILESGKLICALPSADTPLFFESDGDGGVEGFDIDIAKGIAAVLGVEAVFDRSAETFLQLTEKLKQGEVDLVISTYSITPERAAHVNFSVPYMETYMSILIGKQHIARNKIEQNPLHYIKSNNVKIGAVSETSHYETAVALFPNAEIIPLETYDDGYDMITSGELFGFLSSELEFLYAFESNPTISLYASVYSFTDLRDQFSVGVSPSNSQLLSVVNAYINTERIVTYSEVAMAYRERYRSVSQ